MIGSLIRYVSWLVHKRYERVAMVSDTTNVDRN